MYTIYFVPPIYSLTRNGELTSPSPSWSNFWWTRTSKRKKKCREFNKDGRLFIIRRLNITQESARGEEEARGDRANLHMAETCGWKLSTSLHGDFVGYLLRGVKHIYIYTEPCICWSVYKEEEEVRKDSQLVHPCWIYREAGRLDPVFTNRTLLG